MLINYNFFFYKYIEKLCMWYDLYETNIINTYFNIPRTLFRNNLKMVLSIEESWEEATNGFDKDVCHAWFLRLQEVYSEDKRKYHNLDSLRDKLSHYNDIKNQLKNPKALLLALLFQNFTYDPKALDGDNQNVNKFNEFADEAKIPEDDEVRVETCSLLNAELTQEHKVDGAFGNEDAHYLLDLDMAVLGSSPDMYAEYREKIRSEYSFLSEPIYTALRLKVLQNFLQIPNIFATKGFREKFEEQARQNILSEVDSLS